MGSSNSQVTRLRTYGIDEGYCNALAPAFVPDISFPNADFSIWKHYFLLSLCAGKYVEPFQNGQEKAAKYC